MIGSICFFFVFLFRLFSHVKYLGVWVLQWSTGCDESTSRMWMGWELFGFQISVFIIVYLPWSLTCVYASSHNPPITFTRYILRLRNVKINALTLILPSYAPQDQATSYKKMHVDTLHNHIISSKLLLQNNKGRNCLHLASTPELESKFFNSKTSSLVCWLK